MTSLDHLDYYAYNEDYAKVLANLPDSYYQKYLQWLAPSTAARVLDVGCGVGQVVHSLARRGHDAFGVDACAPALEVARRGQGTFVQMKDVYLPFDDASFDAVGCYNVLEHVTEPEIMLREMTRVLKRGGRVVVACPNFLRVAGIHAHHWHTRGTWRKCTNLAELWRKMLLARVAPAHMRFGRMTPISGRDCFEYDDDAVIVTNPVDIEFFLRCCGIQISYRSGVSANMSPLLDRVAELPIVRTAIGATFVVGRKL